ncbi:Trp biosynthesis-associated membrane protein [Conyzicola sp.]|uniref:Trp biosynthesis-associated membrane protein n=1 Tax=Conyzicola sp. TaxID=1969404 RepID=UPI003989EDAB
MSDTASARPPRRTKSIVILASAGLAILTLVSWTQVWFGVTLVDGTTIDVDGQVAAPALSALALTSLVLVGALSIAGPVFRVIFGILESLIGVAVVFSGILAAGDPIAASASAISTATGVSGSTSVADLVDTIDGGFWPWLVIVCGVLIILAGVAIVATSRHWPTATRKYQAARLEPADAQRTSVDDWDSLSGGKDPTTND